MLEKIRDFQNRRAQVKLPSGNNLSANTRSIHTDTILSTHTHAHVESKECLSSSNLSVSQHYTGIKVGPIHQLITYIRITTAEREKVYL